MASFIGCGDVILTSSTLSVMSSWAALIKHTSSLPIVEKSDICGPATCCCSSFSDSTLPDDFASSLAPRLSSSSVWLRNTSSRSITSSGRVVFISSLSESDAFRGDAMTSQAGFAVKSVSLTACSSVRLMATVASDAAPFSSDINSLVLVINCEGVMRSELTSPSATAVSNLDGCEAEAGRASSLVRSAAVPSFATCGLSLCGARSAGTATSAVATTAASSRSAAGAAAVHKSPAALTSAVSPS